MALHGFRKKAETIDDSMSLVVGPAARSRLSARAQGIILAALIAIGSGGFGAVGYASAQSMADGEIEEAQPPEPASTAVAPVDVAPQPPSGVVTVPTTPVAPAQSAPAQSVSAQERPASADHATETQGDVGELQRMLHDGDVTELRTTYNGSYGASLLLSEQGLTYYAALIQQKSLWRVIKTQDRERAEAIYAEFVRQSERLADVEVRRAELNAEMADTDRQIALAQARAERLQADLDIAHQQQALFATRQKALREETAALDSQRRAAQDQLRESRRHARKLQREAEEGLPPRPHCHVSHNGAKRICK
jgi:hypothetical protein